VAGKKKEKNNGLIRNKRSTLSDVQIISIVWYKVLPAVFGGQKGITGFNQALAGNYKVCCLCSLDNESGTALSYKVLPELPRSKWQFLNPLTWLQIQKTAQRKKATHIIAEHPYHGIAAFFAARKVNARLIIHSHNIESERFRHLGKWWWKILYHYEKLVHRKAHLSLFKTEEDKQWAIRRFTLQPEKCMVISYGVTQPQQVENALQTIRQRHHIGPEEKIILFAGTLDYFPNAEAVENIFTQVAPRLLQTGQPLRIIICGRNRFKSFQYLKHLTHPLVIWAGEVPDIAPYFFAASAFINPVSSGAGIQTKNIDAIAHGCTVVCFKKMAAGLAAGVCGPKLLLAENDNWTNFAALIGKAVETSVKTPSSFFVHFEWQTIIQPLIIRIK